MPSNPDNRPLTDQYAQDWHYERTHPRALPLPAPLTDIHDTPIYCARVNEEWLPHIIGMVSILLQHRSWTGTEIERSDAIRQIDKFIAELSSPCALLGGGTLLRQNPQDPCLLEQSDDGGQTWITAFDYSLCQEASGGDIINQITYQTQIENFVQNNINTWNQNQTVNNFAPTLVYDSSGADLNRDVAICYAAKLLVRIILEASAENVENGLGASISSFAVTVLGAIAGAAAGLFTGNPIVGAAVGAVVSSEAAKLVFKAAAQLEIALIDDYVDEMGCMIYSALAGSTPDRTTFEHAVDGYVHDIPRLIVQPFLADIDVWLTFLKLAVEGFELQEYGLVVPCDCITWSHTINLEVDDFGFVIWELGSPPVQGGQYAPGTGWETTNVLYNGGSGDEARTFLSLERTFTRTTLTKFEIEANITFGSWVDSSRPAFVLQLSNLYEGTVGSIGLNRNQMTSGNGQLFTWTGNAIVDTIHTWIRTSRDTIAPFAYDGHGEYVTVTVEGTGFDPFDTVGGPTPP